MNIEYFLNKILLDSNNEMLKQIPSESADCIVTSPPYWGLRDYGNEVETIWNDGWKGQLGLEPHPQIYINHIAEFCHELKRILKQSGSFWFNLGDTYYGSGGAGGDYNKGGLREGQPKYKQNSSNKSNWLQPKQLLLIPSRIAIALQEDGWILRNDIIWHKPNPMPSSAKDRFAVDFEHVFFFVKNKNYFFKFNEETKRCVWSIPTKGYNGVHFAVFPEALVEPCIKVGCPDNGIVLDPFVGSGTTCAVAKKLGRNYIGIDVYEKYCKIARERMELIK